MGRIIYQSNQYAIQQVTSATRRGYILQNTSLPFQDAHSHLNNFKAAKYLVYLMQHNLLPHDLDIYRLESICRVSDRNEYRDKALELLEKKKGKGTKKYININKGAKGLHASVCFK